MTNEEYLDTINPNNWVHYFDSMEEFEEWCRLESPLEEDLDYALALFEDSELFEHCSVIKKVKMDLYPSRPLLPPS